MNNANQAVQLPQSIVPGASIDVLITAFLQLTSNATPASVVQCCYLITDPDAREKILLLALLAAMGNKKVTDAACKALGLVLPAEWKSRSQNGVINFSQFAMLGHMVFMVDPAIAGNAVAKFRPAYQKSLGDAANLIAYGPTGTVPGKEERSKILREWSSRFGAYQVSTHLADLKHLFPTVFGFGVAGVPLQVAQAAVAPEVPWKDGNAAFAAAWLARAGFGGPAMVFYSLKDAQKRSVWVGLLLLAFLLGADVWTFQTFALGNSVHMVYAAAWGMEKGVRSAAWMGGKTVRNPTARKWIAGGLENLDKGKVWLEPYLGKPAAQGALKAISSLEDAEAALGPETTEVIKDGWNQAWLLLSDLWAGEEEGPITAGEEVPPATPGSPEDPSVGLVETPGADPVNGSEGETPAAFEPLPTPVSETPEAEEVDEDSEDEDQDDDPWNDQL